MKKIAFALFMTASIIMSATTKRQHNLLATGGGKSIIINPNDEIIWKGKAHNNSDIWMLENGNILFAAPDDFGNTLFNLNLENNSLTVKKLWHTPLDNCHSSMVYADGLLFGSGYRQLKDWVCITSTGEIKYSKDDLWIHDEFSDSPVHAMILAHLEDRLDLPSPIGVFRQYSKETYDNGIRNQIDKVIEKKGKGDLEKVLFSANTWEVS